MISQTQTTIVLKMDIHTTSLTTSNACGKNSCILKSLCIENGLTVVGKTGFLSLPFVECLERPS